MQIVGKCCTVCCLEPLKVEKKGVEYTITEGLTLTPATEENWGWLDNITEGWPITPFTDPADLFKLYDRASLSHLMPESADETVSKIMKAFEIINKKTTNADIEVTKYEQDGDTSKSSDGDIASPKNKNSPNKTNQGEHRYQKDETVTTTAVVDKLYLLRKIDPKSSDAMNEEDFFSRKAPVLFTNQDGKVYRSPGNTESDKAEKSCSMMQNASRGRSRGPISNRRSDSRGTDTAPVANVQRGRNSHLVGGDRTEKVALRNEGTVTTLLSYSGCCPIIYFIIFSNSVF